MFDNKRITENADGSRTLRLAYPFEHNNEQICELKLRRPTVRALEAMDQAKGDVAKSIVVLSQVSGLLPAAIRQLDAGDYIAANNIVGEFLGKSQAIGESS